MRIQPRILTQTIHKERVTLARSVSGIVCMHFHDRERARTCTDGEFRDVARRHTGAQRRRSAAGAA